MMQIALFLDLDDTVLQTAPKCPAGESVRPAAYRRDGTPLSFMTVRQRALLEMLLREARVIPTTARNLESFRRVDLPFKDIAILNFGGVVLLPNGTIDPSWDERVRPQALAHGAELKTHLRAVERFISARRLGASSRLISDFEMPLYLVFKHLGGDSSKLQPIHEELKATADLDRFFIHANDNNLSLVPRCLGKEQAVRYVIERHLGPAPTLTLGMGDSLTDAPFLDLCDYAVLPRASQLARHLRSASPQPKVAEHPQDGGPWIVEGRCEVGAPTCNEE